MTGFVPGNSYELYVANSFSDVWYVLSRATVLNDKVPETLLDSRNKNPKQFFVVQLQRGADVFHVDLLSFLFFGINLRQVISLRTLKKLFDYDPSSQLLKQLCNDKNLFVKMVTKHKLTLVDILRLLPSVKVPFEVVLEAAKLKPRVFSASSSIFRSADHDGGDETCVNFKVIVGIYNNLTHAFGRDSESLLGCFSSKFFKVCFVNVSSLF